MTIQSINEKLNAPATKKPTGVPALLEQLKPQIAAALPKHVDPSRLARIALTEFRKTPALQKCNPHSFLGAVMQSAQLGFEPGSGLGHAYIVPYKGEAQLQIGYRGMIDLARRSGQIISITARAVYQDDEFSYRYGLDEDLAHVPNEEAEQTPDRMSHVYAAAKLQGGGIQFEVLSRSQVERARKSSKSGSNGPWVTHFEEMAKKTAIRRLFKYLPISVEIQRAVTLDEKAEAGVSQENDSFLETEYEIEPSEGAPDGAS